MNRLQKKCFIVTAGGHLLLLLIVIFGSAFFNPKPKADDSQLLDMIPANLIDAAFSSGVKSAQLPPPTPIPPAPKPVVTPPAPQPEPPKPVVTPPEPVKPTEPDVIKPPQHQINVDLTKVTHNAPKISPKNPPAKPQDDSQAKLHAAALKALNNLKSNFTPATTIDMPGNSSVSYANYASIVRSKYEAAWIPPDNTDSDDANTKVSVTISSDGTVTDAHVVGPSGDASVDASVKRTLERVTFIAAFPDGAKESERTYIINFNLKSKRMSE